MALVLSVMLISRVRKFGKTGQSSLATILPFVLVCYLLHTKLKSPPTGDFMTGPKNRARVASSKKGYVAVEAV
jgi:hypothetical protein